MDLVIGKWILEKKKAPVVWITTGAPIDGKESVKS